MRAILKLVHDTTADQVRSGKLNLYQVLQLLTDVHSRRDSVQENYSFELQGHTYQFNSREFLNLLMRSRNQLVVNSLFERKPSQPKALFRALGARADVAANGQKVPQEVRSDV
jgi:hypothetical protein